MDLTSPFPFRHQRTVHLPKPLEISVNPVQESSALDSTNNEHSSQTRYPPPALRLDMDISNMHINNNYNHNHNNINNDNEITEQPSPDANTPQISTSFSLPRSPLPPSKLANIANALGVNTPMPATYLGRSPSPSTFRSPSHFLLHIVPPPFLPSDDDDDPTLSSSPPHGVSSISINSYRSQFRRGTLIPLYPTLRSQLGAIAREYGLPSTGGLVLYLSQVAPDGTNDGPRISDEVWKLLWYRALMSERQEQMGSGASSRAPSALALRSTTTTSGNVTPSSAIPYNSCFTRQHSSSVSSLSTTPTPTPAVDAPSDTETSTTTSTSNTSPSTAATTTGFTSLDHHHHHQTSHHPDILAIASDLTPNPFLPILAKLEFDIDLRKAKWYDGWLKARKERAKWKANVTANVTILPNASAKNVVPIPLELPDRARSRLNSFTLSSDVDDDENEREKEHAAALSRVGYALLDDDGSGDAEELGTTTTVKIPVSLPNGRDPLAEVFGTDADTWAAIRQENPAAKARDPELIIGGGDDEKDGSGSGEVDDGDDEDEVLKLWNEYQKPSLKLNGAQNLTPQRRPAPPPLKIAPPPSTGSNDVTTHAHNLQNGPRSAFPIMQRSFSETSMDGSISQKKMKHRTGIVFDDGEGLGFGADLGLGKRKIVDEPSELAEGEHDRSSQVLMKQKLDILEKQLAKLSPRKMSTSTTQPPLPPLPTIGVSPTEPLSSSPSPSPRKEKEGTASTSPSSSSSPSASPRKRLLVHKRGRSSASSTSSSSRSHLEHPLLPQQNGQPITKGSNGPINTPYAIKPPLVERPPPPPHLTLRPASNSIALASGSGDVQHATNGIDDSQELIILPSTRGSSLHSAPNGAAPNNNNGGQDSPPLLPLSPDPFGRRMGDSIYMSEHEQRTSLESTTTKPVLDVGGHGGGGGTLQSIAMTLDQQQGQGQQQLTPDKQASRFSADSEQSIEAAVNKQKRLRSNSIMSVRGLRNLWRKSGAAAPPGSGGGGGGVYDEPLPVPLPPLTHVDLGLPTPPLPLSGATPVSISAPAGSGSVLSQHSREESLASIRSSSSSRPLQAQAPFPPQQQPQLRPRRPSVAAAAASIPRPDSGGDPFQFDSVLYKSPSTPTLLNGTTSSSPSHRSTNSTASSKGILKNRTTLTNVNPSEADMRRMRIQQQQQQQQQQSALVLRRPESTTSVSAGSEHSVSSRVSSLNGGPSGSGSPPPSPPNNTHKQRRRSISQSQNRLLQLQVELGPNLGNSHRASLTTGVLSHSLPTGTTLMHMGVGSRFNELSPMSAVDESFEVLPSRRMTPSASYSNEVF